MHRKWIEPRLHARLRNLVRDFEPFAQEIEISTEKASSVVSHPSSKVMSAYHRESPLDGRSSRPWFHECRPRPRSAPAAVRIDVVKDVPWSEFYFARAGAPPAKAPPPCPPSHPMFKRSWLTSRQRLPIVFACSGDPVYDPKSGEPMQLFVDITNTAMDVERALSLATDMAARITDPVADHPSDLLVELCIKQRVAQIAVIVSPSNGRYVV